MSKNRSRIPSPARSTGSSRTPRRPSPPAGTLRTPPRVTRSSLSSPYLQRSSGSAPPSRPNSDSFLMTSPNRQSLLNDVTEIDAPRRRSWWKKLGKNSIEIGEVLGNNVPEEHQFDIENIIKPMAGMRNLPSTKPLPNMGNMSDSSNSESLGSIHIPQRKLFTHRQTQHASEFKNIVNRRESLRKHKKEDIDKTVTIPKKDLFPKNKATDDQHNRYSIPLNSINLTTNTTSKKVDGTIAIDTEVLKRTLFGKRKPVANLPAFENFIMSESDDDTTQIQERLMAFKKNPPILRQTIRRTSKRAISPSSSVHSETMEMENWKLLPSSTMVGEDLVTSTPAKKIRREKTIDEMDYIVEKNSAAEEPRQLENADLAIGTTDYGQENLFNKSYKLLKETATDKDNERKITAESIRQHNDVQPKSDDVPIDDGIEEPRQFENADIASKTTDGKKNSFNKSYKLQKEKANDKYNERKITAESIRQHNDVQPKSDDVPLDDADKDEMAVDNIDDEENEEEKNATEESCCSGATDYAEKSSDNKSYKLQEEKANDKENEREITAESIRQHNDVQPKSDDVPKDDAEKDEMAEDDTVAEENEDDKNATEGAGCSGATDYGEKGLSNKSYKLQKEKANDKECAESIGQHNDVQLTPNGVPIDDADKDEMADADEENEEEGSGCSGATDNDEQIPIDEADKDEMADDEENVEEKNATEGSGCSGATNYGEQGLSNKSYKLQKGNANNKENERNISAESIRQHNDVQLNSNDVPIDDADKDELADDDIDDEENEEEKNATEGSGCSGATDYDEQIPIDDADKDEMADDDIDDEENEEEKNATEGSGCSGATDYDEQIPIDDADDEEMADDDLDDEENEEEKNVTEDCSGAADYGEISSGNKSYTLLKEKANDKENEHIITTESIRHRKSDDAPIDDADLDDEENATEGSGWNSHRTHVEKIAELTVNARKSLRTLVLDKATKTRPSSKPIEHNDGDGDDEDLPNSITLKTLRHNSSVRSNNTVDVSLMSKSTSNQVQTTMESYLKKIRDENLLRNQKIEEKVKNCVKNTRSDPNFDAKYFQYQPDLIQRNARQTLNKPANNKKKTEKTIIDGQVYKAPKLYKPPKAPWINKNLYQFLNEKLKAKYSYNTRIESEKFVQLLFGIYKHCIRKSADIRAPISALKRRMAQLGLVTSHFDFYVNFVEKYMPKEFRIKVIPDIVNGIPMPLGGLFSEIIPPRSLNGSVR